MKLLLVCCVLLMAMFMLACSFLTLAAAPATAVAPTSVAAILASTLGPTSVPATASPTSLPATPSPTLDPAAMAAATTCAEINSGPCTPTPDLEMAAATASPTSPPGLGIGSSQISSIDGMKLLYVPAGNFLMGSSDADPLAQPDEKPQHTIYLDAFWIDQTAVSNAMYHKCVQAAGCKPHIAENPVLMQYSYYDDHQFDNYPMLFVKWDEATAYCTWAGRRLPTEAEWEKAARGTDGRIYPWGNQAPTNDLANYDNNIGYPMPVDSHPMGASPYGALDMAGNVWQWVNDSFYDKYYQCENSLSLYLNLCSPSAESARSKEWRRYIAGDTWRLVGQHHGNLHRGDWQRA